MAISSIFTKQLAAAASNGICTSQSGSAGTPLTLNGSLVSGGVATIDPVVAVTNTGGLGRRVVLAYSGTDTSFTIVGTNGSGNNITDTAVGSSGAAQSNMDFVTVASITPVGGGLTSLTAGTNGVGSSPWWLINWQGYAPISVGVAIELVTGAVNFTLQYTYDDPNNLSLGLTYPIPWASSTISGASASIDGVLPNSVGGVCKAARVLINSGTGELRCRFVQAGAG